MLLKLWRLGYKMILYDLIGKYIVNEKTGELEKLNKFTFQVHPKATKSSVKKAAEDAFSIQVTKVNIINAKGTSRVFKGRKGKTSNVKKAIITLAAGQKITALGGV